MIIVRLKGGMGNQMFQYAFGRALSVKNNTELGLDLFYLLDRTPRANFTFRNFDLDVFNIKATIVDKSNIPLIYRNLKGKFGIYIDFLRRKIFKFKGIEKVFKFDNSILGIKGNVYLDGYWQSLKYFKDIENIIRKDFTLKDTLPQNVQDLMKEIKSQNSLCVHVRRGDYVGNKHHEVVGKEYYEKAIEKMKEITKIDKIYVFSDDIKWCEENMRFDLPTMFVSKEYAGEKAEGHLMLMSVCSNFIIPNSTFAWWGAWLSSHKYKIVIAPNQWFGDKNINSDDLIPKEWIRI